MAKISQPFDSLGSVASRALFSLSLVALSCYGCEERSSANSEGQRDQATGPPEIDRGAPPAAQDQSARDRGGEDRGEERDQRPPPEPEEWPTSGEAELDGAAALLEPVPEGQARAGWVDEPAEALGGANARCRVGCLRLDNEKISICLEGLRTDQQYSFTGGGIIDATLAGDPDGDGLGLILPAPSLGEVRFESAGIIRDGSEGGAAIVQLRGRSQGSRLILGYIPSAQVPEVPVVVEYRLSPSADFLELLLWFGGEGQTVSRMHEILDFGDSSFPLTPGLARGEISPGPFPYLAAYNERVAYLFERPGEPLKLLPIPQLPFQPLLYPTEQLAAGQVILLRRRLWVGRDLESIRPKEPLDPQLFRGPAGAALLITAGESRGIVTQLRLDAEGEGRAVLADGRYQARLEGWAGENEEVEFERPGAALIELPHQAPGVLNLRVSDDAGVPIGARLQLQNEAGDRVFVDGFGELSLSQPAGSWRVIVSAGFERARWVGEVELVAGERSQLEVTLAQEIDREGWASGDFHQHATPSLDSVTPLLDRLLSNVGAGLDFIVGSDHDVITDYRPVIAEADLGEAIGAPLLGVEISPFNGHMGAYGITQDRDHPEGGSGSPALITNEDGPWRRRLIPELVEAARARGAEIMQINHPRDSSGLFDTVSYQAMDSAAAFAHPEWSGGFDSVEVFNGRSSFCVVLGDWLSLLNQGVRLVGVGNSDTHSAGRAPGYPRNYFPTRAARGTQISSEEIIQAFRAGQVLVGGGLLVDLPEGPLPGAQLSGEALRAGLRVRVQSPSGWRAERLYAIFRGAIVWEHALEEAPESLIDLDEQLSFELEGEGALVFLATSNTEPEGLGGRPFSFTNPLWVDGDGDGEVTPAPLEAAPTLAELSFCQ